MPIDNVVRRATHLVVVVVRCNKIKHWYVAWRKTVISAIVSY